MEIDISTFATYAAIVVICYVVGFCCKKIAVIKDNLIPVIVSVLGGILGVAGYFIIPDYPANDIINAIAVGLFSGLASTGVNQIFKQLNK